MIIYVIAYHFITSKSVRFGTEASRMELDYKVELTEEFGPSDLSSCE